MTDLPHIERLRHETRRRTLSVVARELITPNMLRLTLGGEDLAGFVSAAPDDHIKIFAPDGTGGQVMRDYTPRHHDAATATLTIDFALHEAGPVTAWAVAARPGDSAEIGGPRGSQVISGPIRRWLLIGDETALPAIGRRVEELGADQSVTTLGAIASLEDAQTWSTAAEHVALWVTREDPTDPAPLLARLANLTLPDDTFVWIAAEASVARALRDHLRERGQPLAWMKASGYWVAGQADASDKSL